MSGGGVLMDNGTHSVDLLSFVMGPIEAVLAMEGPRPDGMVVEDAARLQLRLADGVLGHVDLSWSIDKSLEDFLHVYGSTGELRVGWKRSQWRNFGTDWQTFGEGYVKAPAMRGPVEALVDRMNGGTGQYLTDGMTAAAVIDAAYRSLASGTWAVVGRPCGAISMQP